jgi:hypothetical protein
VADPVAACLWIAGAKPGTQRSRHLRDSSAY